MVRNDDVQWPITDPSEQQPCRQGPADAMARLDDLAGLDDAGVGSRGDYAVAHHAGSPEAAIIRVTDLGSRAVVRAKVLDPGGRTMHLGWRKGQSVEVSLQRITCTADEWSARAAERKAHAAQVEADRERREQEDLFESAADPTRVLPESYDAFSRISEDRDYVGLIGSTVDRRWGPSASLEGLKALLPVPVLRDLAAAS